MSSKVSSQGQRKIKVNCKLQLVIFLCLQAPKSTLGHNKQKDQHFFPIDTDIIYVCTLLFCPLAKRAYNCFHTGTKNVNLLVTQIDYLIIT